MVISQKRAAAADVAAHSSHELGPPSGPHAPSKLHPYSSSRPVSYTEARRLCPVMKRDTTGFRGPKVNIYIVMSKRHRRIAMAQSCAMFLMAVFAPNPSVQYIIRSIPTAKTNTIILRIILSVAFIHTDCQFILIQISLHLLSVSFSRIASPGGSLKHTAFSNRPPKCDSIKLKYRTIHEWFDSWIHDLNVAFEPQKLLQFITTTSSTLSRSLLHKNRQLTVNNSLLQPLSVIVWWSFQFYHGSAIV